MQRGPESSSTTEPTTCKEIDISNNSSTSRERDDFITPDPEPDQITASSELSPACKDCEHLLAENKLLSSNMTTLRAIVKKRQNEVKTYR